MMSFTEQSRNYCSFGRMIPPSGHQALRLRHVGTAEASLFIAVPAERASGLSRAQYEARERCSGGLSGRCRSPCFRRGDADLAPDVLFSIVVPRYCRSSTPITGAYVTVVLRFPRSCTVSAYPLEPRVHAEPWSKETRFESRVLDPTIPRR